jgi:hypothetical protein
MYNEWGNYDPNGRWSTPDGSERYIKAGGPRHIPTTVFYIGIALVVGFWLLDFFF